MNVRLSVGYTRKLAMQLRSSVDWQGSQIGTVLLCFLVFLSVQPVIITYKMNSLILTLISFLMLRRTTETKYQAIQLAVW